MKMNEANEQQQKQFRFLETLRESGVTNMFGASPYLAKRFNLDKKESGEILCLWMDNYEELFPE